jgi:uncharacterized protein YheU (UPF0270 family)
VEIPPARLTPEALRRLVEEFVSREGTDYGAVERSFEAKVQAVLRQIHAGDVVIIYDDVSETTHIAPRDGRAKAPATES